MLAVASAGLIKYIYISYPANVMALFAQNSNYKILFWYSFKEDPQDSAEIKNYFQLYKVSPNFMNNYGDWLCIELLMLFLGLLMIYFYHHRFLSKLIPKILYNIYIWNLPVSIFLMNFIN
jgi:hypothetical protein